MSCPVDVSRAVGFFLGRSVCPLRAGRANEGTRTALVVVDATPPSPSKALVFLMLYSCRLPGNTRVPLAVVPDSVSSALMSIPLGLDGRPIIATPNARFLRSPPEPGAPDGSERPPAEEAQPKRRRTEANPLPPGPPPGYTGPLPLPPGWVEANDPRYDNATYCASLSLEPCPRPVADVLPAVPQIFTP